MQFSDKCVSLTITQIGVFFDDTDYLETELFSLF
jgi:hypothetical protein